MPDRLEDHLPEKRVYWRDVPSDVLVSKFIGCGSAAHVAVMPDGAAAVYFHEGEAKECRLAMEAQRIQQASG